MLYLFCSAGAARCGQAQHQQQPGLGTGLRGDSLARWHVYSLQSPARDKLHNYLPLRISLHPLMTLLQLSSSPRLLALAWQYVKFLHARSPRQIKITEPLPSICKVMVLLWLYPVYTYLHSISAGAGHYDKFAGLYLPLQPPSAPIMSRRGAAARHTNICSTGDIAKVGSDASNYFR